MITGTAFGPSEINHRPKVIEDKETSDAIGDNQSIRITVMK